MIEVEEDEGLATDSPATAPAASADESANDASLGDASATTKRSLDRFSFLTGVRVRALDASTSASAAASRRYEVSGDAGVPFLRAQVRAPSSGCCRGGGCRSRSSASGRESFSVDVSDFSSRLTVMRLSSDGGATVTIESPPTEVIGYLTVERILCSLRFTLRDAHGTAKLLVKGPRYCQAPEDGRKPRRYRILLPDESAEVTALRRLGPSAVYTMEVPEALSPDLKAMLVGVALLCDNKRLFA